MRQWKTGSVLVAAMMAIAAVWGMLVLTTDMGAGALLAVDAPKVPSTTSAHAVLHPVIIKHPAGAPMVATGATNFHGQPVMASCSSCHATTTPNIDTRTAAELDEFHQGLNYVHGNLTCLSCHNAKNYDTLRMADSRPVEFSDVMRLCSQCHGPQRRDYDMGLHGGMTGYWDLTRGGRIRSTCINCHDPHAPAFPLVMPVLAPRDRISVRKEPKQEPLRH